MVRIASLKATLLGYAIAVATTLASGEEVAVPAESCGAVEFPDDETAVCNVGSSCRVEYTRANGTVDKMWPGEEDRIAVLRLGSERNRLKLNEYQPALVPKYTELGYKKEKLDPATFAYLIEWYEAQLKIKEPMREVWAPDNVYLNHWELDTTMTHAPPRVKNRLFAELSPLMEEWSGQKLKPTSCYGVRHYFRGSVLANHVDRVDTHVISGIINVAQENLDTDWPLYVRGHDGIARDIFIEPGEVIFYESASVIHGRPETFQGDKFANIFVHFAPVSGWDVTADRIEMAARNGARQKKLDQKLQEMIEMEEKENGEAQAA
ncbi:unnamed protein product [Pylaiella littoralis]